MVCVKNLKLPPQKNVTAAQNARHPVGKIGPVFTSIANCGYEYCVLRVLCVTCTSIEDIFFFKAHRQGIKLAQASSGASSQCIITEQCAVGVLLFRLGVAVTVLYLHACSF